MGIHVGGLSSGTDYAGMIEQLMAARRIPIDTLDNKRIELDYDMGAWSQLNTLASSLTSSLDTLRGFDLWRSMSSESSVESVVTASAATASAEQQYSLVVSNLAKAQSISSDIVDTPTDLIGGGYASEGDVFEIEGEEITIEAGETLTSLRTKINSAALEMPDETRVQASIVNNHLVLTRANTGADSISLSDTTGTVLQNIGILDASAAIKNENVAGENAEFTVNGISVVRTSNDKLTDVIEGLTLNLKGVGASTLDIHADREAVKLAISEFVENYNALAAVVDDYSSVELGGSSELAVKGELYGDSLLSSIRLDLRRMATGSKSAALDETNAAYSYNGETGIMDNLSDIGIWTSGETNQLSIVDSSRLDDMLEYEFSNMEQLFKGVYDEEAVAYTNGVASDMYRYADKISASLTGDIAERIESMTEKYDDYSAEMTELEAALEDYEQTLWDQFTAMEDALANMEYQMSYIESMFSSGS
ncbi:flagellar filament capping protein FliD [Pontiella agarivorans]|uniref:Flagellar hook-associated protein 2 n=1 Tax=Pontiella agarivorans TaxID=3038953 RepID=A0ABU5MSS0_9BACT|nr:flagellar filament capping protein FliD [Pontiella agarivorans]MDZ8117250.1 flagellar filament capping protein FliD [Pontiella agarivorans]